MKKLGILIAILVIVCFLLPVATLAQEPIDKGKRFAWENATNELKYLRTYSTKDFPHPTDSNKRIRIESTAILHAFTDNGFEDIYRELPSYDFPEGKELTSKADKYYIMDLPSWGTPIIEDGGNTLRILDKRGTSIFVYSNPIVVEKGGFPFIVKDVDGNVVKHSYESKENLGIGESLEIMPTADKATFEVVGRSMYFKLPPALKNAYPLQAYDAVDTASTNNGDNSLQKFNADTNYGDGGYIYVQRSDIENIIDRMVMDWTLSASGGCWSITAIDLYLYLYLKSGTSNVELSLHELTSTFTELGSTWNKRDVVNNWVTSSGGDYSATVVDASNAPAVGNWQSWTLQGAGATNPIAGLTWGTNFDILLKYTVEKAGGAYEYDAYRSKQSIATPANKPYVQITYSVLTGPTVVTLDDTDVSYTTATLNGNITATGGSNPTIRGFEFDIDSGAPYGNNTHEHGSFGTGTYSLGLTGLTDNTLYYYRAYATNICGTGYGAEGNLTTLAYAAPTVGNMSSTVHSSCAVTLEGNVTAIGGLTIEERGFEWGNATGVYTTGNWTEAGAWGNCTWTHNITNLEDNTTYFWRALARNEVDIWGWSAEGNFTTNAILAPTVVTVVPATSISYTTAIGHGNVTDLGDPCPMITIRGFEWGLVSGVYTGNETEVGSWPIGTFDLTITGLPVGTQIFYRAMAYNDHLWGYGAEGNFTTLLPLPCAPTDLVVTQTGIGNITITWTTGCYGNNTIIRIASEGCPVDPTDGFLVYYGNDTNSVTYSGLELNLNTYCIRAWTENATGNSTGYAETKIGGSSMVFIGFLGFTALLSFIAVKGRWFGFNLMAGMAWLGMFAYIKGNPPMGITEGESVHTIFMLICFGMIAMVVLAGLRRGVNSSRSEGGMSMGEQFGKWHLPSWTKSEQTRHREKRQQRMDNLEDYRTRFHSALNPNEGEHKASQRRRDEWRNR